MKKHIFIDMKTILARRIFGIFFLSVIGLVTLTASLQAQQNTLKNQTPSGLAPGSPAGSYQLSGFENVNLFNGGLSFNLPLLQVGGRGGAGYTMMLPVEQKWSVDRNTEFGTYTPRPQWWTGLKPGYGAGVLQARQTMNPCPFPGTTTETRTNLTFTTPDGTEIELKDTTAYGEPQISNCQNINPANGASRGTTFVSKDGSQMTFVSDTTIYDLMGSNDTSPFILMPSGYLMTKDGVKYRIDEGTVSHIRDRQGNFVNFTYTGSGWDKKVLSITDSLNRQITIEYNVTDAVFGLSDRITFKGHGGATRVIGISKGSLSAALRAGQSIQTWQQLFPTLPFNAAPIEHNPQSDVISSIWLPDGRRYRLFYNSYQEIARVELPTGGAVEYDWWGAYEYNQFYGICRRVSERRVYAIGSTLEGKTVYETPTVPSSPSVITVDQFDAAGNRFSRQKHHFHHNAWSSLLLPDSATGWQDGREFKTEMFAADGATLLRETSQTWAQDAVTWWYQGPAVPSNNPRVTETTLKLAESNQISKTVYGHDQFNNVTDTYEYDFGTGAFGAFKRRSHTDFVTDANYIGANLKSLPSQTWVSSNIDGTNKVSLSQIEYDNYTAQPLVPRSNVIGHDTANFGTSHTLRGNVTKVTSYENAANQTGAISAQSQYDILGNVVKTIDAKGDETTIYYTDSFGSPDGEARANSAPSQLNGQSTFAFATSATNAKNWVTGYAQFDYFTGANVDAEDINGVVSSNYYEDLLDRPTKSITAANLPAFKRQSLIVYDDANRRVETRSDLFDFDDRLAKGEAFYDGLGRTFETRKHEADGGYVVSKTEFDGLGRAKRVTNPYRPLQNETEYWTESFYDSLGRMTKVKTPDNAEILTSYFGNTVTVTDQAGKKRRSVTNGLGQLTRVDEPNEAGQLDVNGVPAQPTNYAYDTLNNLTQVQQIGTTAAQCGTTQPPCTQTRTFAYDSLSRLKTATNPESGLIQYGYDNNGNLLTKIDARSITTSYGYDNLNRVLTRTYTGESGYQTPNVAYTYDDTNVPFSKGKLTKVSSSISETRYNSFDNLGRVLSSNQFTDGQTYNSAYTYNLSGALIEQTYPSGRVVKNTLDQDGDLQQVQSAKANGTLQNFANSFNYTAAGAVSSMRLGNGRWENTTFNSRLQPTQIGLGSSATNQNLLKLSYDYGSTDNNGNVKSQQINFQGLAQPFIQTYTYDSLNRLKSATETQNGTQTWKQTFVFDRFGNRRFDTNNGNTTTLAPGCATAICNPEINATNNRLIGTTFDTAGNTTVDASGQIFVYDAENKQVQVTNTGGINKYFYDGDGKRVKKYVPSTGETTIFVYDASGRTVAEYSTQVEPTATAKVSYLTSDHLGSPRILTDQNGQVISRRDFLPFGEEISRASYGSDSVRQKFTSYERDKETDLDFAQARMYGYGFGRFTSPDPLAASANPIRPQSWNRYSYSYNNPLRFTDPSGMIAGDYYDLDGKFIGTDGKEDGMAYIVYDNEKNKKLEDRKKIIIPDASKVVPAIIKSYEDSEKPTSEYPAGLKKGGFHEEAVVVDVVDGKSEIVTNTGSYSPDPTTGAHVTSTITENTKLKSHSHPSGEKTTVVDDPSTKSGGGTNVMGTVTTSTARFMQTPSSVDIKNALPNGTNIVVAARDKKIYFYSSSGNDAKCNCIAKMSIENFKKVGNKK